MDSMACCRDCDQFAIVAGVGMIPSRPVPVFAVLAGAGPVELGGLASLRSMGDPAVAFVAASTAPETVEVLIDAGWLCVTFAAGDDPAECWQRALHTQRARVVSRGD